MDNADRFNSAFYEEMGSDLLSMQPVTEPKTDEQEARDWTEVYTHLEGRLGSLRTWRWSWWTHWSRLAEFFLPRRYSWLVVANRTWRGSAINDQIIDSTGELAVRTCAAGLYSGLTNPSRPWFSISIALPWIDLDAEGKAWLEDTQEKVYTVLAGSNFYNTMAQAFQDVTVFGTAPVIIYEDYEDIIRCYGPCAGEYYLGVGARLAVDTLYREFTLNITQIIDQFGVANCPEQVTKLWRQGGGVLETEFVVAHAIEPNFAISRRDGGPEIRVVPGSFVFREVYWLRGQKTPKPLSVRGFNSAPFMAARWSTVSNDAYGRSPCMDALGDTKQIQLETLRKAEFIEKGVRPPMGADPSMKNEPSSILPGNITYTTSDGNKKGFWPLFEPNPSWLSGIIADIKDVAARIEKCLFVDLFMAITRMEGIQPRNELELTQRNLERLQELGPFVQMFETEFAGPAVRRVLDIMQRRKMLKPLPKSLRGIPLKIDYVSMMKLAQSASESVAIKDVFQTAGVMSSAAKAAGLPDPLRTLNLDKSLRHYADLNNFPEDCIFTIDEVTQHDAIRAKAKQQAEMPGAAMAAVTAAHTMAQTPIAPGNALSAALGAPQQ